jgi:phytoene/squalene synthetase
LYPGDNMPVQELLDFAQMFRGQLAQHRVMADEAGTRESAALRDKQRAENFPVAMRVLPGRLRDHLVAVYDFARVVDDLGDQAAGDRVALLDAFAADLSTIWDGGVPRAAVLRRLSVTVRACDLPREPFENLVEANRWDQRISRYPAYTDLLAYCALSANPVGRIVLGIFAADTKASGRSGQPAPRGGPDAAAVELSDRVCTALQLVEHWQDVAEDRRAGRVYLPAEDLAAYGVTEVDLDGRQTPEAVRRLLAFETDRAAALLDSGAPLVRRLRGWARLAVAGYVAGGRAAIDSLRRARWDVLAQTPRVRRRDVVRHALRLLVLPGAAS